MMVENGSLDVEVLLVVEIGNFYDEVQVVVDIVCLYID